MQVIDEEDICGVLTKPFAQRIENRSFPYIGPRDDLS
jgi:hypothetical protein